MSASGGLARLFNERSPQKLRGQIRPNIVLYGEGFEEGVIQQAIAAVKAAELIVIVGTSFQVHPFCDLIYEKRSDAKVLVINQTPIQLAGTYNFVQANGVAVFEQV